MTTRQDHLTNIECLRQQADTQNRDNPLVIDKTVIRLHAAIENRDNPTVRAIMKDNSTAVLYATNHIGYNAIEYAIKRMNYAAYSIMNLKIKEELEGKCYA